MIKRMYQYRILIFKIVEIILVGEDNSNGDRETGMDS